MRKVTSSSTRYQEAISFIETLINKTTQKYKTPQSLIFPSDELKPHDSNHEFFFPVKENAVYFIREKKSNTGIQPKHKPREKKQESPKKTKVEKNTSKKTQRAIDKKQIQLLQQKSKDKKTEKKQKTKLKIRFGKKKNESTREKKKTSADKTEDKTKKKQVSTIQKKEKQIFHGKSGTEKKRKKKKLSLIRFPPLKKPVEKKQKQKQKEKVVQPLASKTKPKETVKPSGRQLKQLKTLVMEKEGLIKGREEHSWEELDFYPLIEPFAYALIVQNKENFDRRYLVVEQILSEEDEKNLQFIKETLTGFSIDTDELDAKGVETLLEESVTDIIKDYSLNVNESSKRNILYRLKRDLLELGKLSPLMKDRYVEDISCDGAGIPVYLYHRDHGSIQSNVMFADEEELSGFVVRLAQRCGKHISIAHPMLDATMPDGSRIQMTLSTEVTSKGSTFTIRKFREEPFSPVDIINFNTMSPEMVAYFWMAVEYGVNALIAGGTASGKTSTLNAIALFIPREAKIVSIEETREINLPHPNWIPGVARSGFGDVVDGKLSGEIDMYDLMKAALRQRPEYILVGEIRGREAYVLFQAMATGHITYSTVHADSTKSLIHRLEGEPINIPRIMLQSLDVVCLQTITRVKNKRGRRCKQVIEIIDIDPTTKEILTNEVFRWDPVEDRFVYSGKSYVLERIRVERNLTREEITTELRNRTRLLEWMRKHNIHSFKKVASLAASYRENPEELMKKIEKDL